MTREPIPAAKLRALAATLERDHVVRFNAGSQIEYEDCRRCGGAGILPVFDYPGQVPEKANKSKGCPTCGGEKVRLLVTRPAGGVGRYRLDREMRAAYEMALYGPAPVPQPTGDPSKYGEVPF